MSVESNKDFSKNRPSQAGESALPIEDFTPDTSGELETVEKLEETVRKLQEEKKQLTDQLLRKQADVDNFRKRLEREKEEFKQYSLLKTVEELLPILDGFELALGANAAGEEYRKGVALIHQKFSAVLERLGLKPVESKGCEFDPQMHQAVATVESDQHAEHEILEELQRGYFFKDRLLRPAMVTVAKRRSG